MKVFIVSHNYPSEVQPYIHTFVKDHFDVVNSMNGFTPKLLIPTPRLLPFTKRRKQQNSPLLDSESGQRIQYFSIPKMLSPKLVQRNITKRLLQSLPPPDDCIVHIHWIYPSGLAIPTLKEKGFCSVLTVHRGDWYQTISKPRLLPIIEKILFSADKLLVSGPRLREDILERFPDLDIEVSYNYINTKVFSIPASETRKSAKMTLGWEASITHFFTIANIRYEKGIDCLIDAIQHINRDDLHFHILGRQYNDSYSELLKSKISGDSVTFHDPVPREDLINYFNAADAYVLPSRSEGFNVSLLEAAAAGLPIITTKTGGAELLIENCGGFLAEPGSVTSLVKCLNEYLSIEIDGRSQKSAKYIQELFSFEQFREKLYRMYDELIFRG